MNLIKHVFNVIWLMAKQTNKKIQSEVSKNKAFKIANNPKCDGYQRGLASMIYKFFDKKSASLKKNPLCLINLVEVVQINLLMNQNIN